MYYKDLKEGEKILFNKIEDIFFKHETISREMFVKVLAVLLNKHKKKKKD